MLKRPLFMCVFVGLAALHGAAQQAPPATPPPPPATRGTPATYLISAELSATLKKAAGANPTGLAEAPVKNTDQYRVNLIRRGGGAGAIVHTVGTELHYIVDGAGTFVTGGKVVRIPGGMATIEGGESRRIAKGDVVVVPENTPHWYKDVEGSITYLEVRFNVPVK